MSNKINNVSCIGCGTIGAGWVTRFLANQIKVKIYDPTPYAETRLEIVIKNTKRAYKNIFPNKTINFKKFEYFSEISPAIENADLVYLACPPTVREKYAIKTVKMGKALFLEKPFGINIQESRNFIKKLQNYDVPMAVNFTQAAGLL